MVQGKLTKEWFSWDLKDIGSWGKARESSLGEANNTCEEQTEGCLLELKVHSSWRGVCDKEYS